MAKVPIDQEDIEDNDQQVQHLADDCFDGPPILKLNESIYKMCDHFSAAMIHACFKTAERFTSS